MYRVEGSVSLTGEYVHRTVQPIPCGSCMPQRYPRRQRSNIRSVVCHCDQFPTHNGGYRLWRIEGFGKCHAQRLRPRAPKLHRVDSGGEPLRWRHGEGCDWAHPASYPRYPIALSIVSASLTRGLGISPAPHAVHVVRCSDDLGGIGCIGGVMAYLVTPKDYVYV